MKTALTTNNGITTYNVSMSAPEAAIISGQILGALIGKTPQALMLAVTLMQVKDISLIKETLDKMATELIERGHDESMVRTSVEFLLQIYVARLSHIEQLPEGTNKLA